MVYDVINYNMGLNALYVFIKFPIITAVILVCFF